MDRDSRTWASRYGERHRLVRIVDFPSSIVPPRRVRIYRRAEHYVLQAWDPYQKRTISDRVEGDLLAALVRARAIDERLEGSRRSGVGAGLRLRHEDLVDRYLTHLSLRADAGEIDPATVRRYQDALAHYLAFCRSIEPRCRVASQVDEAFVLELTSFLNRRSVPRNGRSSSPLQPMKTGRYVLDTVRAMYAWGADPLRGNLLPTGFVSPFSGRRSASTQAAIDMTRPLIITQEMAEEFLSHCDRWQFELFLPVVLFGLRASEPTLIFREHGVTDWLRVGCEPTLDYWTKGRRDKRLPLLEEWSDAFNLWDRTQMTGLLLRQRQCPPVNPSLEELVQRFRDQCDRESPRHVADRRRIRDQILRAAGGLTYDCIEHEFKAVARQLGWPKTATLKGFRHLFSTVLENGGMPEFYRRYLMGQSSGRTAIVTYTHLNKIRDQYRHVMEREWPSMGSTLLRAAHHLQPSTERCDPSSPCMDDSAA